MMGGMMGGMGFGFVGMALFWIVILAGVVLLAGKLFPRSNTVQPPTNAPESAIEVVRRRYASGEISREEYEELRHGLEQPGIVGSKQ